MTEFTPAPSQWRKEVSLQARKAEIGLDEKFLPNEEGAYLESLSCVAVHSDHSIAALGNTGVTRDMLTIVRLPTSSNENFTTVAHIEQRDTFSHLSWSGDSLLCGSYDGVVYRYRAAPGASLSADIEPSLLVHPELNASPVPPPTPGEWMVSSRVNRVVHSPHDADRFVALENRNVHVWSLGGKAGKGGPARTVRASTQPVLAASFAPLCAGPGVLAVGGESRALRLVDLRAADEPLVWRCADAHAALICDVQWSPFVPHWVASAGADGLVKVWDLRMSGPRALGCVLADHTHTVRSVAWCPRHADLLCSGSSDRRYKLWSLTNRPHHLVASRGDRAFQALAHVAWAPDDDGRTCFAFSTSGDVAACSMQDRFLVDTLRSRFADGDKPCRDVERYVRTRRLEKAFERARAHAQKLFADAEHQHGKAATEKLQQAQQLLELCYQRAAPESDPARFLTTTAAAVESFGTQALSFAYYLPPNYPDEPDVDDRLLDQIATLKVNVDLRLFSGEQQHEQLDARQVEVCELLMSDLAAVSRSALSDALRCLFEHNAGAAVSFAQKLNKVFTMKGKRAECVPLLHDMIRPTIYDRPPPPQVAAAAAVTSPRAAAAAPRTSSALRRGSIPSAPLDVAARMIDANQLGVHFSAVDTAKKGAIGAAQLRELVERCGGQPLSKRDADEVIYLIAEDKGLITPNEFYRWWMGECALDAGAGGGVQLLHSDEASETSDATVTESEDGQAPTMLVTRALSKRVTPHHHHHRTTSKKSSSSSSKKRSTTTTKETASSSTSENEGDRKRKKRVDKFVQHTVLTEKETEVQMKFYKKLHRKLVEMEEARRTRRASSSSRRGTGAGAAALDEAEAEEDDNFITWMERHKPPLILSVRYNEMYLRVLLRNRRFDLYYLHALALVEATDGYEYNDQVCEHVLSSMDAFRDFLEEASGTGSADDRANADIAPPSNGVVMVVHLLQDASALPKPLYELLNRSLGRLGSCLKQRFDALRQHDRSQCKEQATMVGQLLSNVLGGDAHAKLCKEEVNAIRKMLATYASGGKV